MSEEIITDSGVCTKCGKKLIVAVKIPRGWDELERKEILRHAKEVVLCANCRMVKKDV